MAESDSPLNVQPGLYDQIEGYDKYMRFVAEGCRMQQSDNDVDVYVVTPFIDDKLEDIIAWAKGYNPHPSPSDFLNFKSRKVNVKLYVRKVDKDTTNSMLDKHRDGSTQVDLFPIGDKDHKDFHCKWAAIQDRTKGTAYVLHTSANVGNKHLRRFRPRGDTYQQREFFETVKMTTKRFKTSFLDAITNCSKSQGQASSTSDVDQLSGQFQEMALAKRSYFGLYDEADCFKLFKSFVEEGYGVERGELYVATSPYIHANAAAVLGTNNVKTDQQKRVFYARDKMKDKDFDFENFLKERKWERQWTNTDNKRYFHCKWAAFAYTITIEDEETKEFVDLLLTSACMTDYHMSTTKRNKTFINSLSRIDQMPRAMFEHNFLNRMDELFE